MSYLITADNSADNLMSDLIKHKYSKNIDYLVNRVKITPSNFKDAETLNRRWVVYLRYQSYYSNKPRKYERTSYTINHQQIDLNRIKNHKDKVKHAIFLKNSIVYHLKNDVRFILTLLYGKDNAIKKYPSAFLPANEVKEFPSIEIALNEVLATKKDLSSTYYNDLNSVKKRFLNYLGANKNDSTELLNKKLVVSFLNHITSGKSSRTYNNIKTNLKTFLEGLKDLEYIERNFLDGVKNKQTKAKRNTAFTIAQKDLIFSEAKKHDKLLYFYLMHVYYEIMRPQTVSRIKVKDIDLSLMQFKTDTKTD